MELYCVYGNSAKEMFEKKKSLNHFINCIFRRIPVHSSRLLGKLVATEVRTLKTTPSCFFDVDGGDFTPSTGIYFSICK